MGKLWSVLHTFLDRFQFQNNANPLQRYGFTLVLVGSFFIIKSALTVAFGNYFPFLFAAYTVILCAWFGGFGPGILASLLTAGIIYFAFLTPLYSSASGYELQNFSIVAIFILQGFIISVLSESHRKSDEQKNQFIGIISHELKNPLAAIKGFTDLIKQEAERKHEKKLVKYSKVIDTQVGYLTQMINEMLDITTIETGRLTYHDESFTLQDLVKEVIANQQVYTDTHKIVLKGKAPKRINGDRYRIGQVLNNLINNAIKYSLDAKKNQVVVKIKNTIRGAEIRVQDFGPGISVADQQNIFKPFFRAKKTVSTKGTGIGLYISSKIIQRHKGKIWCESVEGKGSLFVVQLPSNRKI